MVRNSPTPISRLIGIYYVVFIVVDLLAAMVGFLMDRREDWRLLLWLPLQRFGYRQLMYYVVLRSIVDGAARALCRLGQAGAARHGQDRARRPEQRLDSVSVKIPRSRQYPHIAGMTVRGRDRRQASSPDEKAQIGAAVDQSLRHQMHHAFGAFLHLAFRQKQARAHHFLAVMFEGPFPDHHIADAGLVATG